MRSTGLQRVSRSAGPRGSPACVVTMERLEKSKQSTLTLQSSPASLRSTHTSRSKSGTCGNFKTCLRTTVFAESLYANAETPSIAIPRLTLTTAPLGRRSNNQYRCAMYDNGAPCIDSCNLSCLKANLRCVQMSLESAVHSASQAISALVVMKVMHVAAQATHAFGPATHWRTGTMPPGANTTVRYQS